jgi:hypothetical protein
MTTDLPPEKTVALAENATGWLKPQSAACLNRRQSSMD